ncbi:MULTISPECIES: cupin domain-containing protein [unclassified Streptomyces]|uniref:cupin domain-containing protein n=1 Tax=unclassified Streptomyces TaxID=2593676 RepID=UPI00190B268D|nr:MULTISPECIES: cupin domain-containing protein [unclassified Streptomyces]MBK3569774.1 cupin domain-containing protein [Streptomyces sp. MBT62]MBK6015416.1 cupin domain-containing protein [Streptomyces sp. MBT53]
MTHHQEPAPVTRQPRGPVRKFGRALAPGVTLHDLVLPPDVEADKPFVLNTAVLEEGAELPLHAHPEHEIWVVSSGHGRLDRGAETLDLTEGDVVLFHSGVEHHLANTGDGELRLVSVYWGGAA